jgi:hypothetical protein
MKTKKASLAYVVASFPGSVYLGSHSGNPTQLGRFSGTAHFILNVCDLSYIGTYEFTAAIGDSISGPFHRAVDLNGNARRVRQRRNRVHNTGRFANAIGTFA